MATLDILPKGRYQLSLDGKPLFLRAAEVHNSSFSSVEYMAENVWPRLKDSHINFALVGVGWEQIEPAEGGFQFEWVAAGIEAARKEGIHLGLLWFGSFKNGCSSYVPEWVKRDTTRFPRVEIGQQGSRSRVVTLSTMSTEAAAADSRAFARLMAFLKEFDGNDKTVLLVQVENECGVLGDTRDRSPGADRVFQAPVPENLVVTLRSERQAGRLHDSLYANLETFANRSQSLAADASWPEVFGDSPQTDEIFMAYHHALFVQQVAAAGKQQYDVIMYTNAWLRVPELEKQVEGQPSGGCQPGEYPSGGPVDTVLDIWQLYAPALSFLSPDIYTDAYSEILRLWTHRGQPLFIPEQAATAKSLGRMWCAIASYNCLATAPFGIDYAHLHKARIAEHFELLDRASEIILSARRDGRAMHGFCFDEYDLGSTDPTPPHTITMGNWKMRIERGNALGHPPPGYGMVVEADTGSDTFWLVGQGFKVIPMEDTTAPKGHLVGLSAFREMERNIGEENSYRTVRWLNGDESREGTFANMPVDDPDYGGIPAWCLVPCRTRIATCSFYSCC